MDCGCGRRSSRAQGLEPVAAFARFSGADLRIRGENFLRRCRPDVPDCLIVDLQMPEMNGLELQQHLVSSGIKIPTILITAHGDVVLRDHGGGLVASLRKPLQEEALFDAIDKAVGGSRGR